MPHLITKQPGEKLIKDFDFSNEIPGGDSLSSATYTVKDMDGVDVTNTIVLNGSKSESGNKVYLTFINGADKSTYRLEILATTTAGQIFEAYGVIRVRDK